jgi:hypothetical protein
VVPGGWDEPGAAIFGFRCERGATRTRGFKSEIRDDAFRGTSGTPDSQRMGNRSTHFPR